MKREAPPLWQVGLAVVMVVAGLGMAIFAIMRPDFGSAERVLDDRSIDAALHAAGAQEDVVTLVSADGETDLLYVGAPSCGHCQDFMAEDFAALVALARDRDIDLAYIPAARMPIDTLLAAAKRCLAPTRDPDGVDLVKRTYDFVDPVAAAASVAARHRQDGMSEDQAMNPVWEVMESFHKQVGSTFDRRCHEAEMVSISRSMGAAAEALDLNGTPSFYIETKDGVRRITGRPGDGAIEDLLDR